jgi:hypothetical protein
VLGLPISRRTEFAIFASEYLDTSNVGRKKERKKPVLSQYGSYSKPDKPSLVDGVLDFMVADHRHLGHLGTPIPLPRLHFRISIIPIASGLSALVWFWRKVHC